MLKAVKVKFYPSPKQKMLIEKHFGCCRYIYNYALDRRIKHYQISGETLSIYEIMAELPQLKKKEETIWLSEVYSVALQQAIFNLDSAFSKFFKKTSGFPKFKAKYNSKQSYRLPANFEINNKLRTIKIPKLGWVSFIDKFKFKKSYTYKQITVSKDACNNYFISVLYDNKKTDQSPKKIEVKKTLGIDLGIHTLATLSNGIKIENPKFYEKYKEELAKAQSIFSKKIVGSNNRLKQKKIVAKKHLKISNSLKDTLHKLSTNLVENQNYDSFAMEHLDVQSMDAKHHNQQGWNMLKTMLEYKCKERGKNLLTIGKYDPSSKKCGSCGHINESLTLKDRTWVCPQCGAQHNRDLNAANNIKLFALVRAEPLKL